MLRRIGEMVRTILSVVEAVEQLKAKNDVLTERSMNCVTKLIDRQASSRC
jgi:hypothetical protein